MKWQRQSLGEPLLPIGGRAESRPALGQGGGEQRRGGAEVSGTRRHRVAVDLRRVTRVGAWNILSLSNDDRLPVLSRELSRLNVALAALSEVRRPGTGVIREGG